MIRTVVEGQTQLGTQSSAADPSWISRYFRKAHTIKYYFLFLWVHFALSKLFKFSRWRELAGVKAGVLIFHGF